MNKMHEKKVAAARQKPPVLSVRKNGYYTAACLRPEPHF